MSEKKLVLVGAGTPENGPATICNCQFESVIVPGPGEVVVKVEDLRRILDQTLRLNYFSEWFNTCDRLRALLPPEEPELLPCPAEGLTNSQHHPRSRTVGNGFYAIVCICGVSGPESATEKNALAWWNALPRRADTPAKGES